MLQGLTCTRSHTRWWQCRTFAWQSPHAAGLCRSRPHSPCSAPTGPRSGGSSPLPAQTPLGKTYTNIFSENILKKKNISTFFPNLKIIYIYFKLGCWSTSRNIQIKLVYKTRIDQIHPKTGAQKFFVNCICNIMFCVKYCVLGDDNLNTN